jgi:hypothetical protein
MLKLEKVDKTIKMFRDYVIREAKDNLKRGGKYGSYNNTSELSNSIKGEIVSEDGFTIVGFTMANYGAFVDKGVKGKTSSIKAPNSPFKFGSGSGQKVGLTAGIKKWVRQKGFQFRSKEEGSKGRFLSYDSTAYLITRSIFNKGIKPSLFFTKPFEAGYKKYIDVDLLKAFGQDVETMVDVNLKDIK